MHSSVLILVSLLALAASEDDAYMMRRSEKMEDQGGAASGYVYSTDSNGPTSYMSFNTATGNADKFAYPAGFAHYAPQKQLAVPLPYTPQLHYPQQAQVAKAYTDEDGSEYDEASQSKKGEKGSKGYKEAHAHESGSKGEHDSENHKGHYNKEGANKSGHHEEGEGYASKHQSAKGSKGGSFSDANSHKKGSKTTGFHKVYHKDEYKKDHTFYDESDASGHYDKHGSSSAHKSSEEGAHKKGGSSDSGYKKADFGKQGSFDKGHHDSKDSGYKGEKGDEEFHSNFADYAQEGGKKNSKAYGYEDEAKKDY